MTLKFLSLLTTSHSKFYELCEGVIRFKFDFRILKFYRPFICSEKEPERNGSLLQFVEFSNGMVVESPMQLNLTFHENV